MARTTQLSLKADTVITLDTIASECDMSRTGVVDQIVAVLGRRLEALKVGDACALSQLAAMLDLGMTERDLRRAMTPEGHRLSPHWLERQRSFPEAFDEIKLAMDDARGGRRANGTRHLYVFVPSDLVGLPPGFVAPHYRPHGEEAGIIDPDPAADPEPSDDR